ncbi:MAG: riboflavin biosynthesis protein RibF [Prevotellaceae bacterium]|jgi:riboflavin kinase/FMN adenylyltransferase|nr:riboflavin biosynthesis protein RibF [Prevotellaceae bacterium]
MVVAATGFFDGVHIGHGAVLSTLCRCAKEAGTEPVVITFWPHPRAVLQHDAPKFRLLNSLDEKKELMLDNGVTKVHVLSFTQEFSLMNAKDFFSDCLQSQYGVTHLVVGYDHKVGHDAARLDVAAKETGIRIIRVGEALCDGKVVSSTKIREAIHTGDMEQANRWLGYPYALSGVVVEGNKLGRTIGFPTANMLLYEPLKQLPADGVYGVEVEQMGKRYCGMMNIGFRPTVATCQERTIETHIFDFDFDIYGLPIVVYPLFRVRGEQIFGSMEALRHQLSKDKEKCVSWSMRSFSITDYCPDISTYRKEN